MEFDDASALMMPQTPNFSALGSLLAQNPEQAIPLLVQAGVAPPKLEPDPMGSPWAPHNLLRGVFGASPTGAALEVPPQPGTGAQSFDTGGFEGAFPTFAPPAAAAPTAPQGTGVDVPLPRPRPANLGDQQPAAAKPQEGGLARALSGVKAPAPPEIQKLRTPDAMKAMDVMAQSPIAALLQAILGTKGQTESLRLGQAVGGR